MAMVQSKYHLDLEQYGLDKFKLSIQRRQMIPSRVMLKENLDEHIRALEENGIQNLKQLTEALKNAPKIESFSNRCGLSVEYLKLLNREAKSFLPNPVKLSAFPGINSAHLEALENVGIKNTKQLFDKHQKRENLQQLSKAIGVPAESLSELLSLSDLARLYGVGPVFARIIYDVGITSVEEFVKHSAEEFIEIYESKTSKKADFSTSDISFSLELAKELV